MALIKCAMRYNGKYIQTSSGYYLIEAITDEQQKLNTILDKREKCVSEHGFETWKIEMDFHLKYPNSAIIPKGAKIFDPDTLLEIII